jgi:uncharacterized membrane protein
MSTLSALDRYWLVSTTQATDAPRALNRIEYYKKKKSKNKIQFLKDPMFKAAEFKKDKIKIADGLSASSSMYSHHAASRLDASSIYSTTTVCRVDCSRC